MKDHMHTTKIHFYQLGLGGRDIVSPDGWKLRTLSTIQKQLKHSNVSYREISSFNCEHPFHILCLIWPFLYESNLGGYSRILDII